MPQNEHFAFPVRVEVRSRPCKWKILERPTPREDLARSLALQPALILDPWKIREQFLALKQDLSELAAFLNQTGQFTFAGGYLKADRYWECQSLLKNMLLLPPKQWLVLNAEFRRLVQGGASFGSLAADVRFDESDGIPSMVMVLPATLNGMLASIHIDHIRGLKYAVCARPDCPLVFKVESRHKRKYCKHYCAHIEQVRRSRRPK